MKRKKQDKATLKQGLVVFGILIIILLIGVIFQGIFDMFKKQEFTIYYGGIEVNNLTACCVEFKDIDYFENRSYYYNTSQTSTVTYMDKKTICFPEEQNILRFDCKLIEKKDLDREWLDRNSGCIDECPPRTEMYKGDCHHRSYIKCSEKNLGGCSDSVNLVWNCEEYKFGDYIINIEK